MKKVICIMGPTASGKTKVSLEVAKAINGEIINGDSVQVYKELNIGSAKITKEEMGSIKHHLLSIVNLETNYTVFDFQQDARKLINDINRPILVGGSGLYIKSAVYNYEFEEQDEEIKLKSLNEMISYIKEVDPKLVIDWNNERRVISAYKNIMSGNLRSDKIKKDEPLYNVFLIYLDVDRKILEERLIKRLENMIDNGFINEVEGLIDYPLNIIGYREIKEYMTGLSSLEEAKNKIIRSSMRFAKRQRTWFLNQMNPHVYDALSPTLINDILNDIGKFLKD